MRTLCACNNVGHYGLASKHLKQRKRWATTEALLPEWTHVLWSEPHAPGEEHQRKRHLSRREQITKKKKNMLAAHNVRATLDAGREQ